MHNTKSICQDGFKEVYAANMTKPRTKVLKTRHRPGRKRMDDEIARRVEVPVVPPTAGAVDIERFSKNIARMVEEGGKALAAYLKPREEGNIKIEPADEIADVVKTLGHVAEYWLSDPQRALEIQPTLGKAYLELGAAAANR